MGNRAADLVLYHWWRWFARKRGRRVTQGRDATKMIEQTQIRRRGKAAIGEARLRQQAIGVKLRQIFEEVVNEPVPSEFLDILRRADERGSGES
jgi:hypothetical protein